jgi:hypothetical protein
LISPHSIAVLRFGQLDIDQREPLQRGVAVKAVMKIEEIAEVAPAPDGAAIVVKADVLLGDQRTAVEIAIATDLAAKVAIALLATTAKARAERDGLEPALDVLAAAVVASGCAEKVRLQLLFEKGAVLPLEVPVDAAQALQRGLTDELTAIAAKPLQ